MKYANEHNETAAGLPVHPEDNLTSMMQDTRRVAADIHAMADNICSHLFGSDNAKCEKEAEPRCFRDVLTATQCELVAAAEVLSKLCCLLGV